MLAADRVIDMGLRPRAGGRIVFDGTPATLRQADTLTGQYLSGRKSLALGPGRRVSKATPRLILEGARQHNLAQHHGGVSAAVPGDGDGRVRLGQPRVRHFGVRAGASLAHERLLGADHQRRGVCRPVAHWQNGALQPRELRGPGDSLRELASAPLRASYTASKFSFNSGDGCCPTCSGWALSTWRCSFSLM